MKESNHIEYSNPKGHFLLIEVPEDARNFNIEYGFPNPADYTYLQYETLIHGLGMAQRTAVNTSHEPLPTGAYTLLGASDDEKFPYEEIVESFYDLENLLRVKNYGNGGDLFRWKDSFTSLLSHLGVTKRVVILKKK